jgi:hypothetical protein
MRRAVQAPMLAHLDSATTFGELLEWARLARPATLALISPTRLVPIPDLSTGPGDQLYAFASLFSISRESAD